MVEKIGGAWILMSGCEVMSKLIMSKLIMSSLGRTHAVKHDTKHRQHLVLAVTEHDITRPKLTFCAKQ